VFLIYFVPVVGTDSQEGPQFIPLFACTSPGTGVCSTRAHP
jgi:hypothetical protein